MEMTTEEPTPFSWGVEPAVWVAGRTCYCRREGERSRESARSLWAGQEDLGCRDGGTARGMEGQRDGRKDGGTEG